MLADLRLPDELQLLPPEMSEFRAPAGPALRLRQRAYSEQTRAVSDYLTYAYLFPDTAWLLSMSFPLPGEAERWLPELDRMAGAVELAAAGPP